MLHTFLSPCRQTIIKLSPQRYFPLLLLDQWHRTRASRILNYIYLIVVAQVYLEDTVRAKDSNLLGLVMRTWHDFQSEVRTLLAFALQISLALFYILVGFGVGLSPSLCLYSQRLQPDEYSDDEDPAVSGVVGPMAIRLSLFRVLRACF